MDATISEKAEVIGYLSKMRDDARLYLRTIPDGRAEDSRSVWEERAQMCDRAVRMLVDCSKEQT